MNMTHDEHGHLPPDGNMAITCTFHPTLEEHWFQAYETPQAPAGGTHPSREDASLQNVYAS
jgi:hypothetical protein